MKSSRRFTLLIASMALVLGSIAPPALAARPVKPPPSADLSLSITDSPDPAPLEGEITYDLTISNAGPSNVSAALDVSVPGSLVTSWSWSQGTCTSTGSDVHCELGLLRRNGATRVTVVVKPGVESLATGVVTLSGNVHGNQPDPDTSNNQESESTTIIVSPLGLCDWALDGSLGLTALCP